MQIFIPFPDVQQSAKILDYRRLGKQRSEALTLIRIITGYHVLALLYQVVPPATENEWPAWCKQLCQKYREDKAQLLLTQNHQNIIQYYVCNVDIYKLCTEEQKKLYKLVDKKMPWWTHVATLSWVGNLEALKYYYNTILQEWINRGYNNTMQAFPINGPIVLPAWFGDHRIHQSHRSKLYQKDPEYYSIFKEDFTPATADYVWPRNQFTMEQLKNRVRTFDI